MNKAIFYAPRVGARHALPLVQAQPIEQPLTCRVFNDQSQDKTNHCSSTVQTLCIFVEAKLGFFELGINGWLGLCHRCQNLNRARGYNPLLILIVLQLGPIVKLSSIAILCDRCSSLEQLIPGYSHLQNLKVILVIKGFW